MMHPARFCWCLAVTGLLSTAGQSQEIIWGTEFEFAKGVRRATIALGHTDDAFYVTNLRGKKQDILEFDMDAKLVGTQEFRAEVAGRKVYISDMIETANGYFGLAQTFVKGEKKMKVLAFGLRDDGKIEQDGRVIIELPFKREAVVGIGPFLFNANVNSDRSGYDLSPDKQLVAFIHPYSTHDDKRLKDKQQLTILDANMEVLASEVVTFPYSDDDFSLENFSISNSGHVYFCGPKWKDKEERKKGSPSYDYHVIKWCDGEMVQEYVVENDSYAPTEGFVVELNDEIYVTGMCTDRSEKSVSVHGSYLARFNADGSQEWITTERFDEEVMDAYLREKDQKKGQGIGSMYLDHVFVNRDKQTISFLAERFLLEITTTTDANGNTTTRRTWHSKSIIMPRYSYVDGGYLGTSLINKSFKSQDRGQSSYAKAVDGNTGEIYLFFNDSKSKNERQELGMRKGNFADLVGIDSNGEIFYRETVHNTREHERFLSIQQAMDLGNGTLMIPGRMKKNVSTGILDLPRK